jgi:hypothetical protein
MLNLVQTKNSEGLINRKASSSEEYMKYLSKRLFYAMGKQKLFCPNCGGVEIDPNNFEEIKYCPKCGYEKGFGWEWQSGVSLNKSIDILINAEVASISLMIIMLEKVVKKHGLKINWYHKSGDKVIQI